MIAPQPYKYKCSQCKYTKVVKPESDVIDLMDLNNICPKCKSKMERESLNILDKLFR